ncbi:hypothetical protein BOSEA1005_11400 [Hyphomicrobiales bacterium]|nr:hypothetical protein BOSEA1005_11400 [Hyphomicrobiales bacterium]CAI0342003.1 hypothetical protein BO1005MUT1_140007 [Hyphomicrobiales bacterium]
MFQTASNPCGLISIAYGYVDIDLIGQQERRLTISLAIRGDMNCRPPNSSSTGSANHMDRCMRCVKRRSKSKAANS